VPYKDPVKRDAMAKVYKARWYQKNKQVTKERTRANKKKQKVVWDAFKASQACSHCGTTHPSGVIIDFHHVDRTDKQSVHHLVKNYQFAAAMEEVKKCIPLCANCHRILHWEERLEPISAEKSEKRHLKAPKRRENA
jgi:hypothetical protein